MNLPTPRSLNYRFPAEWEPQEAIWLAWPHNEDTWPGGLLEEVKRTYVEIIRALHSGQKIKLLVSDVDVEVQVRSMLVAAGIEISQVVFFRIATADVWIRDYGPTFIVHRQSRSLAMVKWIFNAWGNKYADLITDDRVPHELNRYLELPMFEPHIVFEGGSIEVNGAGIALTTQQCLLNKNRNPNLSRAEIEDHLKEYLGLSNIVWLNQGIVGDDTDGHIDDIARFVAENTVVCAFEEDPSDKNYEILKENYELLLRHGFRVVKLPMPGYVGEPDCRLPASYANFYIGNHAVAVPLFGHANDQRALAVLQDCFPNRQVVGIDCGAMVYGLGTLHCCSQQQPLA